MEELSDFEKQRLANIAERDNLLKKLTQNAQSSGVGLPPRSQTKKPLRDSPSSSNKNKKKAAPHPKIKDEVNEAGPRRTSSRLRGIAAESEVAKRKADDEYDAFQEAERAKRVRKSDAFSFDDMVVSGGRVEGGSLVGGLGLGLAGGEKSYERTFGEEDIKNTTDKDLKALREEMSGLQLWDAWEPNRISLSISLCVSGMGEGQRLTKCRDQDYPRASVHDGVPSVRDEAVGFCRRQDGPSGCVGRISETSQAGRRQRRR